MTMLAAIPLLLAALSIVSTRPVSNHRRDGLGSGSWSYAGCFQGFDPVLWHSSFDQSIENCQSICAYAGYPVAGLYYSFYCGCTNLIPTISVPEVQCNAHCLGEGNEAEYCGGADPIRTSIYIFDGSATPTLTTTTTGSTLPTPTNLASYDSWSPLGCYVDSTDNRTLPVHLHAQAGIYTGNVEGCLAACQASGYIFGGVENGSECYCGMEAPQTLATDDRCGTTCTYDITELCGGPDGIYVYQAPGPARFFWNHWRAVGCYADSTLNRVLPHKMSLDPHEVNVRNCLDSCSAAGYAYAGLENQDECWCGDSMPTQESDNCNRPCPDYRMSDICGGETALNVYKATPPSQWTW